MEFKCNRFHVSYRKSTLYHDGVHTLSFINTIALVSAIAPMDLICLLILKEYLDHHDRYTFNVYRSKHLSNCYRVYRPLHVRGHD